MHGRHRGTLAAIFREPTSATIEWVAIESLLLAVGCVVVEGRGSRVRFIHAEHVLAVHRPHPAKEAKRGLVRAVRDYLLLIGVTP